MSTLNFKADLENLDKKYMGKDDILGKGLLTLSNKLNSSRSLMWGSQTDQIVPLEKTEIPLVHTNYEYIVGKYSSAYYKAEDEFDVVAKITKFPSAPNAIYELIVFNKRTRMYDVIYRVPGERLTETYGYKYVNDNIDSIQEGDTIDKDDILYRSTSFNEDMMYGYGINVETLYTTDPMTIEDAIVISESTSSRLTSIEYDVIRISLNDNDLLINLYGDKDNYKAIPDIGEEVKDSTLAVKRRIIYSQSLFDLKEENMRKVLSTDTPYYVPFAEEKVVDISVYCNKPIEELKDTTYNKQIHEYLKNEMKYYQEIVDILKPIVEEGKGAYTDDLAELYSRARRILDPETKWKDSDNRVFNNIILEVMVEKRIPVVVGSKICGRFGDKGIISEIRPDEAMPISKYGTRCGMICNILGVGNRLNPGQFVEIELNFQASCIQRYMKESTSRDLKEFYLFEFIGMVNKDYAERLMTWYKELSNDQKELFLEDCENNAIFIHQPPLYGNVTMEQLEAIYDRFNIKPITMYIEKFGRMIKIMQPMIMGKKYIVKLKHHPKSKFSSRSTGYINSKDQPTKTSSTKQNKSIVAGTPIKFGDMETLNLLLNNDPDALVKMMMLYASSPIARRDVSQLYENGFVDEIEMNEDARNRNVEIMNVHLKALGIGIDFEEVDDYDGIDDLY